MKDNIEIYKIWAPDDALWTQWAKPVIFFNPNVKRFSHFDTPEINSIEYKFNTMIIVDLDGADSVREGIALAQLGYRPVPLYNGVKGPNKGLVDIDELERSIYWGAGELEKINIKSDARPAFLLDSRRMRDAKYPGAYDNRWCIFPQDMPSADFLVNEGIKNVFVITKSIQDDLSHILCRYQEKGISILKKDRYVIKEITIHKPSRYKSLKYRLKVILGLKRNSAGGFGGYVPDPTQYNSGTGYRGIG